MRRSDLGKRTSARKQLSTGRFRRAPRATPPPDGPAEHAPLKAEPAPEPAPSPLESERARLVLDCAARLAGEGGIEAVRMRDIATQTGLALGTLYRQFPSKDAVLLALLEREVGFLESSMAFMRVSGDTYVRRAVGFFDPVTRIMCGREKLTRALLATVAAGNPELHKQIARYHKRSTTLIAGVLAGDHPPKDEPRALDGEELERVAYILSQTWFAALIGWMGGQFAPETVVAHVENAAVWLVRGALCKPPGQ